MKVKPIQSVLLAAGLAMAMPLLADDDPNLTRLCDELVQQKGDSKQDGKRDPRCAEPVRPQVEEGSLPVSGEMSRNIERASTSNPAASPVATPAPGGRAGR